MMQLLSGCVLLAALAWLAPAAAVAPGPPAKVRVVCTLADLAALAREVGGPDVEVVNLVDAGQDAHYVDARPSLMLPLARADLLIINGLELEIGWLPPLQRGARNAAILFGAAGFLDASTAVRPMQTPGTVASRSQGDVHPAGNPHYLHDARAAAAVAQAIGQRLAQLDPGRAARHRGRAAEVSAALSAFAEAQRKRFSTLPAERRRVVVYHQSLVYLLDWLGLEQAAAIEPLPGIPPNPGHIAKVLVTMRAQAVPAVLQEPYYPRNAAETLARLAKAKLVVVPGGADVDRGESYLVRIRRTVEAIHVALR